MQKVQAKKKFGQNFLHNTVIQKRFAEATQECITNNPLIQSIIEVGPGMGAVTQHLLTLNKPVEAYEIDPEAITYLQAQPWASSLTLHYSDFLQVAESTIPHNNYVFVSNLPFNIGSRILVDLSLQEYIPPFVVVLQKEVIEKILKHEDFSLFGSWLSLFWKFHKVCDIAPGNFVPAPKVTSTLVSAVPIEISQDSIFTTSEKRKQGLQWFKQLVRFPSKTLYNNMRGLLSNQELQSCYLELQLEPSARLDWNNYQEVLTWILQNNITLKK